MGREKGEEGKGALAVAYLGDIFREIFSSPPLEFVTICLQNGRRKRCV